MSDAELIRALLIAAAHQESLPLKALLKIAAERIAELKIIVDSK